VIQLITPHAMSKQPTYSVLLLVHKVAKIHESLTPTSLSGVHICVSVTHRQVSRYSPLKLWGQFPHLAIMAMGWVCNVCPCSSGSATCHLHRSSCTHAEQPTGSGTGLLHLARVGIGITLPTCILGTIASAELRIKSGV